MNPTHWTVQCVGCSRQRHEYGVHGLVITSGWRWKLQVTYWFVCCDGNDLREGRGALPRSFMLSRVLKTSTMKWHGCTRTRRWLGTTSPQWSPGCPLRFSFLSAGLPAKPVPLKVPSSAKKNKHTWSFWWLLSRFISHELRLIFMPDCCVIHIYFFDHAASRIQMRPRTVWRACLIHAAALSFFQRTHSGRAQRIHEGLGPLCWLLNIALWSAAEGPATIVVESRRVQPFCCLGHKRRLRAAYEVDFVPLFFFFCFSFILRVWAKQNGPHSTWMQCRIVKVCCVEP